MADSHAKNHDYHLVDPSPWPFVGSVFAFVLAFGAIHWMHGSNPAVMIVGLIGVSLAGVSIIFSNMSDWTASDTLTVGVWVALAGLFISQIRTLART